jgi:hypothetical protein
MRTSERLILRSTGLFLAASLFTAGLASATPITSAASITGAVTTTFNFPTATLHQPGPFVIGNGITVSGSTDMSVGGTTYGLNNNGNWSSDFFWAATDSSTTSITFNLGGLFGAVGGFMNYATGSTAPIMSAIAADGVTVLESWDLSIVAPINTPSATNGGAFRGIARPTADIAFFRLQGGFLIEHDITTGRAATVPEPATLGLLGTGLLALARRHRRRS